MNISADAWARIKDAVKDWPPLVDDQRSTVASLTADRHDEAA